MKSKRICKRCVDLAMTAALLLLMTYEQIGQAAHEWLGVGMFLLLVAHHALNAHWVKSLFRGRYTPCRILRTGVALCILVTMLGSMLSGVALSQSLFPFVRFRGFTEPARAIHMLCAYWGFLLMGLHFGLHWDMFAPIAEKRVVIQKSAVRWLLRALVAAMLLYGAVCFRRQGIVRYLFLIDHFVFFDFTRPVGWLLLDEAAVMAIPIAAGRILAKASRAINRKKA